MTDIEKMAREAGLWDVFDDGEFWKSPDMASVHVKDLERFAQAVARRCAEICREEAAGFARTASGHYSGQYDHMEDGATSCEQSIRAEFEIKEEP